MMQTLSTISLNTVLALTGALDCTSHRVAGHLVTQRVRARIDSEKAISLPELLDHYSVCDVRLNFATLRPIFSLSLPRASVCSA